MKNLFTCLLMISCFLTYAADLLVFPGGSTPNYSSITSALSNANDGDRILVGSGNYANDITLLTDKNITIMPMVEGERYTIAGKIYVPYAQNSSIPSGINNIYIYSADVVDNIEVNTSISNYSSSYATELNFIDCEFNSQVSLNSQAIIGAFYYCTFLNNLTAYSYNIIGNTFSPPSTNYNGGINCNISQGDITSHQVYLQNTDKKHRIYANKFNFCDLRISYTSNPISESVHIANNYFNNAHQSSSTYEADYGIYNTNGGDNNMSTLVENNTFRFNSYSYIYYNMTYGNQVFRNNLVLSSGNSSLFYKENNSIIEFEHNYISNSSAASWNDNNLSFWYNGSSQQSTIMATGNMYVGSGSTGPASLNLANGYWTGSTNTGKDHADCRDIDNTINDIGTYGGPNSWENYHNSSYQGTGKARIIYLDVPSTYYGLPGVTFDIKGKAVNTNK